ncbi:MAG: hypothetical protein J5940_01760 [Clostridia bacterium]|nr:hypothetical protein [Clostridia bacterium]
MFGYVRPSVPDLLVRDHEHYKAVYCGICRTIKKRISRKATAGLSYDSVFLALFRAALTGERFTYGKVRCGAHPLKKRNAAENAAVMDYCAYAFAVLCVGKLHDDVRDEKGLKRFFASRAAKYFEKRVPAGYRPLLEKVDGAVKALAEYEAEGGTSPDVAAEISGRMLAEVFAFGLDGEKKRIADEVGFQTGRWVYYADACADFEKDAEKGSYNPLSAAGTSPDGVYETMRLIRAAATSAVELADFSEHKQEKRIIDNILYLGLDTYGSLQSSRNKRKCDRRRGKEGL